LLSASFTAFPGENESFFDAAILIFSPLAGFRPSRSAVALNLNLKKPGREISAPLSAAAISLFGNASIGAFALSYTEGPEG